MAGHTNLRPDQKAAPAKGGTSRRGGKREGSGKKKGSRGLVWMQENLHGVQRLNEHDKGFQEAKERYRKFCDDMGWDVETEQDVIIRMIHGKPTDADLELTPRDQLTA